MSYQVLARKWRPRNFTEMLGQQHVLRALVNALDSGRLHHAYLFSGTRGVGKTTIARILAKAINCETGITSSPCGECSACRAIDEGRFVDLIEVDAASRTKVEDTRELLENVQYAPTSGRYKVYLIDEVHMLSQHSFNALLKTLEEPPEHVKFLLATTEPEKLPVTILSRCLQFNLKRMAPDQIVGHLARILGEEGIAFEHEALALLANAADGSVRDGLSLLDQAIAFGGGRLEESEVRAMLGTVSRDYLYGFLDRLAVGDGAGLMTDVRELVERTPDFTTVLADLLALLHEVALAQAFPGVSESGRFDAKRVGALADRLPSEEVQLYYQIGLLGRRELELASDPGIAFEMVMLRMLAFRPVEVAAGSGGSQRRSGAPPVDSDVVPEPGVSAGAAPDQPTTARSTEPAPASQPIDEPLLPAGQPPPAPGIKIENWDVLTEALDLKGMVHELAANCQVMRNDSRGLILALSPSHRQLHTENLERRLGEALSRHFERTVRLRIEVRGMDGESPSQRRAREQTERHRAAVEAIEEDPLVRSLQETFDAEVQHSTIRPVDTDSPS
jgi:DNA polymerase-3 subunit gamma/tau